MRILSLALYISTLHWHIFQWTLVCERLPLLSTVQGSYMGGVFVGCLVWGWASDKYGRRMAMMAAIAIQVKWLKRFFPPPILQ